MSNEKLEHKASRGNLKFLPTITAIVLTILTFQPFTTDISLYDGKGTGKYGGWSFLLYFDDEFNFNLHRPQLNSLSPLNIGHLFEILRSDGINVYEPIWCLWKAACIDFIGLDPWRLRLISLTLHIINANILLPHWMQLMFQNLLPPSKQPNVLFFSLSSFIFAIHPLNVEVIGWLSAQGYVLSLFFALLSNIYFELSILHSFNFVYTIISILCYISASFSKAPGVIIAVFQIFRLASCVNFATIHCCVKMKEMEYDDDADGSNDSSSGDDNGDYEEEKEEEERGGDCIEEKRSRQRIKNKSNLHTKKISTKAEMVRKNVNIFPFVIFASLIAIVAVIIGVIIIKANTNKGTVNVGHSSHLFGRLARSAVIIWNFTCRLIYPFDLRIHYNAGVASLFHAGRILSRSQTGDTDFYLDSQQVEYPQLPAAAITLAFVLLFVITFLFLANSLNSPVRFPTTHMYTSRYMLSLLKFILF